MFLKEVWAFVSAMLFSVVITNENSLYVNGLANERVLLVTVCFCVVYFVAGRVIFSGLDNSVTSLIDDLRSRYSKRNDRKKIRMCKNYIRIHSPE